MCPVDILGSGHFKVGVETSLTFSLALIPVMTGRSTNFMIVKNFTFVVLYFPRIPILSTFFSIL